MSASPRTVSHREDIKAAIRKRGLTLRDVCSLVDGPDVSPGSVSDVLACRTTSARIEAALAQAAGMTLAEVQNVTRARSRRAANDANIDANIRPARTGQNRRPVLNDANADV